MTPKDKAQELYDSFYAVSLPKLFIEEFAKVVIKNHKTLEI